MNEAALASSAAEGATDVSVGIEPFERWVKVGILITIAGYSCVLFGGLLLMPGEAPGWTRATQGATIVVALVALGLALRGRVLLGGMVTLFAVWFELLSGFPVEGLDASALIAFPVLVAGGGVLLAGRSAYVLALGSSAAIALLIQWFDVGWSSPVASPDDPRYLWLVCSISMLAAAGLTHLGVVSVRRGLSAIRASERRLSDLLDNVPYGVLGTDSAGAVTSVNPAAEPILDLGRRDLLGRSLASALEAAVHPADIESLRALLHSDERGAATVRFGGPGEEVRWIELVIGPVRWADGSVGRQVTLHDVSERQRAAENERTLRKQLEHAQRLEAVGRLAGGVAHEFNNLLTVMGGAAELILLGEEADEDDLAREILNAKTRGAALTRQLLAFARKEIVQPARLSLPEVVGEIEALLRRFLTEKHAFELCIVSDLPEVVADRAQVEQILVNLVVNAKDAMEEPGRVVVGLGGPGASIPWRDEAPTLVPDGFVALWVDDSGEGMGPQVLERAFEPFFTARPWGRGTGLGLATVHGIVSQNGGTTHIRSHPGAGTSVIVFWPVAPDE